MLIVHYEKLKQYDPIKNAWEGKKPFEVKKQADTLGWLLMSVGINEINEKTTDEIIFRTKFLDFCWGGRSYFVGDPSISDLRQLLKNYIGLRIEITNRNMKNISTRHKFMVNQLQTKEEYVLKEINK